MLKKLSLIAVAVGLLALAAGSGIAHADDSWTGEIVEKACFVSRGAHGPDHAECAKSCFSRGGDVGLLTADGELIILKAGEDAAPFEALKELAGAHAKVSGTLMEEEGVKVVTVTASEAVTTEETR